MFSSQTVYEQNLLSENFEIINGGKEKINQTQSRKSYLVFCLNRLFSRILIQLLRLSRKEAVLA